MNTFLEIKNAFSIEEKVRMIKELKEYSLSERIYRRGENEEFSIRIMGNNPHKKRKNKYFTENF